MKVTVKNAKDIYSLLLQEVGIANRTRAKQLLKHALVKVNGNEIAVFEYEFKEGDVVEILKNAKSNATITTANLNFPILFEDDFIIIVVKPAGLLTADPASKITITAFSLVNAYLKANSNNKIRAHLLHRLDKEVSGLLMLAKSGSIQRYFKQNWKDVEKKYIALVHGKPELEVGTITGFIKEGSKQKMEVVNYSAGALYAVTNYKIIKDLNKYSALEISLETGRKNQIRVHLASINCPIVGDRRYGCTDPYTRRIRLHAYYLAFLHPQSKEKIILEAPLPKGFYQLLPEDEQYKNK